MSAETPSRIVVVWHIFLGNNHSLAILQDQLETLKISGLANAAHRIYYSVTGDYMPNYEKGLSLLHSLPLPFESLQESFGNTTWEAFTLTQIPRILQPEDTLLYFHTKGITQPYNPCVTTWRKCMEFFLITHWRHCVRALQTHDTAGIKYSESPCAHYSGNFWWSRGAHFLNVFEAHQDLLRRGDRYQDEFFIGRIPHKSFCLYSGEGTIGYEYFSTEEEWAEHIPFAPAVAGEDSNTAGC